MEQEVTRQKYWKQVVTQVVTQPNKISYAQKMTSRQHLNYNTHVSIEKNYNKIK